MTESHFRGVIQLQKEAFPPPFDENLLWSEDDLVTHISLLPSAQWVAIEDGQVVGSCSNTRISEENYQLHSDWDSTVGGYRLQKYDANGSTLYGLDISVSEHHRGKGIGRAFYEKRKAFVRKNGLSRYATGCRLPDFRESGFESVYEFIEQVRTGRKRDRTLSPLLKYDLRVVGVHTNYMVDEESKNCAALLEWVPREPED
jgi:GNAT superfamily N-acetyltransferase